MHFVLKCLLGKIGSKHFVCDGHNWPALLQPSDAYSKQKAINFAKEIEKFKCIRKVVPALPLEWFQMKGIIYWVLFDNGLIELFGKLRVVVFVAFIRQKS